MRSGATCSTEQHWGSRAWQALHQLSSCPPATANPLQSGPQRCQPRREVGSGARESRQWLLLCPGPWHSVGTRGGSGQGGQGQCPPGRCPRLSSSPKGSQTHRHTLHLEPLVLLPRRCRDQGWGSCSCSCPCQGSAAPAPAPGAFVLCPDTGLASVLLRLSLHFAPHKSRYLCAFTPAG